MNLGGFQTEPYYYTDLGTYRMGVFPETTTYTWKHKDIVNNTATAIDTGGQVLYTSEDLTKLGTVTGNVTLNITGSTTVDGDVFGGGESSSVDGSTTVNILP